MADHRTLGDADPHEEIVRLEENIEELAAKLESCRKFILASRVAVAGGALVRERDGKGDQRSRIGACSSDRTDQSACHLIADRCADLRGAQFAGQAKCDEPKVITRLE